MYQAYNNKTTDTTKFYTINVNKYILSLAESFVTN